MLMADVIIHIIKLLSDSLYPLLASTSQHPINSHSPCVQLAQELASTRPAAKSL